MTMKRWLALALVVLAGLALRAHALESISLWLDETDLFFNAVYGAKPQPLVAYALERRERTTGTAGWPAFVWVSARAFGRTAAAARSASVAAGTAAIATLFLLIYLAGRNSPQPFYPALFAAIIAAVSIPLIELSQRTYAYGATPFFSACILLAHLNLVDAFRSKPGSLKRPAVALLAYAAVTAFALFINPTMTLAAGVSFLVLLALMFREWIRRDPDQRSILLGLAGLAALVLFLAALINLKNPKFGFRPYMVPYYHPLNPGAIPFLFQHAYDLLSFHLDLFYERSLYWPLRLNAAMLPLMLICLWGWVRAALGKFGSLARHFAGLGAVSIAVIGMLSLVQSFPFGGVRQSLFLTPFTLGFTGFGFYSFATRRWLRVAGTGIAAVYLVAWAAYLPALYRDRAVPFTAAELVQVWEREGKLPFYAQGGCELALQYMLRSHPEIPVLPFKMHPPTPYLMISMHWPAERTNWYGDFAARLKRDGYQSQELLTRPAKYLDSWEHPICLYFPPNGLWIYKITR